MRNETEHAEEELKQAVNKLRRVLGETVNALALASEKRDPYTAGHQWRTSRLARAIAQEVGLPREQVEGIRVAGALHDIGKLHVPAEILNKPGRLNETEFYFIRNHPQIGYDILKDIEFDWPVAKATLQHHERLDGSGYPLGISEKKIILEAKILAVADVVEAMLSHRTYRPAHSLDKVMEEITQNKDILYDSKVVDACLKLFTEKGFKLTPVQ